MPLQGLHEVSRWAISQDPLIRTHLDGACLWEAVAAGCESLKEYAACFHIVSLRFTKGLGAPIRSIIVGSKSLIKGCLLWPKMLGGGIGVAGVVAAPARVSVQQVFLGGRLHDAAQITEAKKIAQRWDSLGGKLQESTETVMIWLNLTRLRSTKRALPTWLSG